MRESACVLHVADPAHVALASPQPATTGTVIVIVSVRSDAEIRDTCIDVRHRPSRRHFASM